MSDDEETVCEEINYQKEILQQLEEEKKTIKQQLISEEKLDQDKYIESEIEKQLKKKYGTYLIIKELGAGAFGSVQDYYDVLSKKSLAKKYFADIADYKIEKDIMMKLNQIFSKEKIETMICTMTQYDAESQTIYYDGGVCNLQEMVKLKIKHKKCWWDSAAEVQLMITSIGQIIIELGKQNCYHSDIKLVNAVYHKFDGSRFKIKLIDMGGCCFDENSLIAITTKYFPPQGFVGCFNPCKDKENRLLGEFYTLGRTFQEMCMSSFYAMDKKKYNHDYKAFLRQYLENDPKSIKTCIEMIKTKYPAYIYELLEMCLSLEVKTSEIIQRINKLTLQGAVIQDNCKMVDLIIQNKEKQFFIKASPNAQIIQEAREKDREWWMPSKMIAVQEKIKALQQSKSIQQIVDENIGQLEFCQEFDLPQRGLEILKNLFLPQKCLDHVILAYFFAYFAVKTESDEEYNHIFNKFNSSVASQFKKQSMKYYHLFMLQQIKFENFTRNKEDYQVPICRAAKKYFKSKKDKYYELYAWHVEGIVTHDWAIGYDVDKAIDIHLNTEKNEEVIYNLKKFQIENLQFTNKKYCSGRDLIRLKKFNSKQYNLMVKSQVSEFNHARGEYHKYNCLYYDDMSSFCTQQEFFENARKAVVILDRLNVASNYNNAYAKMYLGACFKLRKDYPSASYLLKLSAIDFQQVPTITGECNDIKFYETLGHITELYRFQIDQNGSIESQIKKEWEDLTLQAKKAKCFKLANSVSYIGEKLYKRMYEAGRIDSPESHKRMYNLYDIANIFKVVTEMKREGNYSRAVIWLKEFYDKSKQNPKMYTEWDNQYVEYLYKKYSTRLEQQRKDPKFTQYDNEREKKRLEQIQQTLNMKKNMVREQTTCCSTF